MMKVMRKSKNHSGFTIIEVLIVLAVAGILLGIVFFAVPAMQRMARNYSRRHDVDLIAAELSNYATNGGTYPFSATSSAAFISGIQNNTSHPLEFHNGTQPHDYIPPMDQITYQSGHWCNRYGDGDAASDPIAGTDTNLNKYVVWTQIETASGSVAFYCVDNHG